METAVYMFAQKRTTALIVATIALGCTLYVVFTSRITPSDAHVTCGDLRRMIADSDLAFNVRVEAADRAVDLKCMECIPVLIDCAHIPEPPKKIGDVEIIPIGPDGRVYPFAAALFRYGDAAVIPICEHLLDLDWEYGHPAQHFQILFILDCQPLPFFGRTYLTENKEKLGDRFFPAYQRRFGTEDANIRWNYDFDAVYRAVACAHG